MSEIINTKFEFLFSVKTRFELFNIIRIEKKQY